MSLQILDGSVSDMQPVYSKLSNETAPKGSNSCQALERCVISLHGNWNIILSLELWSLNSDFYAVKNHTRMG